MARIPVQIENSNQPGQKFSDEFSEFGIDGSYLYIPPDILQNAGGRIGQTLIFQLEKWPLDVSVESITIKYANGITRTITRLTV